MTDDHLRLAAQDIKQHYKTSLPRGEQPPDIVVSGGRLEISSDVFCDYDLARLAGIAQHYDLTWAICAIEGLPRLICAYRRRAVR
jgi:hypothetical protein